MKPLNTDEATEADVECLDHGHLKENRGDAEAGDDGVAEAFGEFSGVDLCLNKVDGGAKGDGSQQEEDEVGVEGAVEEGAQLMSQLWT